MKNIFVQIKCDLGKVYQVAGHIGRYVNDWLQTIPDIKDTFTTMAFKAFM